jgi:hypothetical protein
VSTQVASAPPCSVGGSIVPSAARVGESRQTTSPSSIPMKEKPRASSSGDPTMPFSSFSLS